MVTAITPIDNETKHLIDNCVINIDCFLQFIDKFTNNSRVNRLTIESINVDKIKSNITEKYLETGQIYFNISILYNDTNVLVIILNDGFKYNIIGKNSKLKEVLPQSVEELYKLITENI